VLLLLLLVRRRAFPPQAAASPYNCQIHSPHIVFLLLLLQSCSYAPGHLAVQGAAPSAAAVLARLCQVA
jgi:hypothetical protein